LKTGWLLTPVVDSDLANHPKIGGTNLAQVFAFPVSLRFKALKILPLLAEGREPSDFPQFRSNNLLVFSCLQDGKKLPSATLRGSHPRRQTGPVTSDQEIEHPIGNPPVSPSQMPRTTDF
jgi:hypothetical protein